MNLPKIAEPTKQMYMKICLEIEEKAFKQPLPDESIQYYLRDEFTELLNSVQTPEPIVNELLEWTLSRTQPKYNLIATHLAANIWFHYYKGLERNAKHQEILLVKDLDFSSVIDKLQVKMQKLHVELEALQRLKNKDRALFALE